MVCVANGEKRSETCEYALTPGSVVGCAGTLLRRTSTASSKGLATGDASMSSVRSMRGV